MIGSSQKRTPRLAQRKEVLRKLEKKVKKLGVEKKRQNQAKSGSSGQVRGWGEQGTRGTGNNRRH